MGNACDPENLQAKINGILGSEGFSLPSSEGFEPATLQQRYHLEKQLVQPEKTLKAKMEAIGLEFETSPDYERITKTFDKQIEELAEQKTGIDKPKDIDRIKEGDTEAIKKGKVKKNAGIVAVAFGDYIIGGRSGSVVRGAVDAAKLKLDVDPESKLWMNRDTTAPNRIFGPKIFDSVANEIRDLHKQYGGFTSPDFQREYRNSVAKIAKAERQNLENIIRYADDMGELESAVQTRYGIERQRVYDLHNWLKSLENPFQRQKQGVASNILEYLTDNYAKRTAIAKPTWWLFNVGDASRIVSEFMPKPGGAKAVYEGLMDTFNNNGYKGVHGAFLQHPDLKARGIYDLSRDLAADLVRHDNNLFAWTNNFQLNLAYNIGQRYNGKGLEAMQNSAFHHEWFNQPKMMREFNEPFTQKMVFGLMRYMINENIWYFNQARWMFSNDTAVRQSATASLTGYTMARAMLFGVAGVVPAPIFPILSSMYSTAFNSDMPEDLRETDRLGIPIPIGDGQTYRLPVLTNLAGKAITGGANFIATQQNWGDVGEYEVNLGEAVQPLGGGILVRAKQVPDTISQGIGHLEKAVDDGLTGNLPATAVDGLAGALTLGMMLDLGPMAAVNDLTARGARYTAREMRGGENYTKALMQTIAGSYNVKKVE